MRIYVTGNAASGKTTLARKLSKELGVKFYSTDDLYNPKLQRMFIKEEIERLIDINSDWIVEGAYFIPDYIKASDKVIYLTVDPLQQFFRIIKRHFNSEELRSKYSTWETLRFSAKNVLNRKSSDNIDLEYPTCLHYKDIDRLALVKRWAKEIEYI